MMKPLVLLLVLVATVAASAAVTATKVSISYSVINDAPNTAGGRMFAQALSVTQVVRTLNEATDASWNLFAEASAADRRDIHDINLVVVDSIAGGKAVLTSRAGRILLSAEFIAQINNGNIVTEITGILYSEVAKVWQWNGQGRANSALLQGVADVVRLRAGYAPADWVREGEGAAWNQPRRGVTARFLNYLDRQHQGFLAALNAGFKQPNTGLDLFTDITGKDVNTLWAEYKAAAE